MSDVPPRRRRGPARPVLIALVAAVAVVIAVVVVLVATSGPSSPGEVTFTARGVSETADPTAYCDLGVTECETDPDAVVSLSLPPLTPLDVDVPEGVSSTPWQLAFTFRDATGAEQSGRSPVFAPGALTSYTLALPDPRLQIERVEVQQYGARLVQTAEGPGFSTRSTWVLAAAP